MAAVVTDSNGKSVKIAGRGFPGPSGTNGMSAYDYAVAGGYTGTETEFQALMGTGPWVPQAGYVPASNPNLLDNWYFPSPINQMGKTEYIDLINAYGPDRWKSLTPWGSIPVTVKLKQTGLAISGKPNPSIHWSYGSLMQFLPKERQPVGQVVTLSALVTETRPADNGLYCGLGRPINTEPFFEFTMLSHPGLISHTFIWDSNNPWVPGDTGVGIIAYSGTAQMSSVTIKAMKLELGDQQTLARQDAAGNWVLDPPPDKGVELLKCQRYFQIFSTQEKRSVLAEDFRPVMRINPALTTMEINGGTWYVADANL